jgi:cytochrome P450 family 4
MFNPLLRSTPLFYVSGLHRRQKQSLKILHSFTESVIKKRRDEIKLNENFTKKQKVDEFGIKRKMAFLDILLQSEIDGRLLTDKDIREEVDTFMFEGHDTTASAIVFTLYNIAKFPVVQSKIYEECELFLGDKNEPRSSQQMNELSYLEQVIKETLRLYPSVPFFSRKIKEEVDCGEYLIPENVTLAIAPYSMARNPNTYPNPLEFDPSRFSLENDFEKRNPFSFIPFSAGPRNCKLINNSYVKSLKV